MAASVKALLFSTQILRSRAELSLVLILLVLIIRVLVVPGTSG